MPKEKREFKGVWFPAEVWLDNRLTALEKIILMEIDSLDNDDNCYASNEYLAQFCQCSQSKVSKSVAKLKSLGYVEVVSFDGRNRKLRSCLAFFTRQTGKNDNPDWQNLPQRILEESPNENTKEDKVVFSEIIAHLNEKTGKNYRLGKNTRKLINARLSEGYSVDDFKRVIDVKCAEWKGTDFEKYLQPSTLFAPSHFDEYLNTDMPRTRNGGQDGDAADDWQSEYSNTPVEVIDNSSEQSPDDGSDLPDYLRG